MERERITKIQAWADKQAEKYYDEYQMTGSASTLRTYEKYDDISHICGLAIRESEAEDETRMRIRRNQKAAVGRFRDAHSLQPSKTYSAKEVEEWMEKMIM